MAVRARSPLSAGILSTYTSSGRQKIEDFIRGGRCLYQVLPQKFNHEIERFSGTSFPE